MEWRRSARSNGGAVKLDITWQAILRVLLAALAIWLLIQLWQVALVVVVALALVGALSPIVDMMERRGVRRFVALSAIITALVLSVVGIGFLVVPAIFGQVSQVLENAPAIQAAVAQFMGAFPALRRWQALVAQANPDEYLQPLTDYALAYMGVVVQMVVYAITAVFLAFYILADRERVTGYIYSLAPRRYHVRLARVMLDMETVVGGYMRGQALTSLGMFVFTYVLLTILGAPNAFAIAVFAAFADLVPFVGTLLATIPIVIAALAVGPVAAGIALVASLLYDQFEGRIFVPRIYGATMRLSPVIVLLALLVGGTLLGVVGALLALPIAAGVRVLIEDLRIDLPGEQPGEVTERAVEDEIETTFAERAAGASAEEAAIIATELAGSLNETTGDETHDPVHDDRDETRLSRAG